jgi:hypothetical protein
MIELQKTELAKSNYAIDEEDEEASQMIELQKIEIQNSEIAISDDKVSDSCGDLSLLAEHLSP